MCPGAKSSQQVSTYCNLELGVTTTLITHVLLKMGFTLLTMTGRDSRFGKKPTTMTLRFPLVFGSLGWYPKKIYSTKLFKNLMKLSILGAETKSKFKVSFYGVVIKLFITYYLFFIINYLSFIIYLLFIIYLFLYYLFFFTKFQIFFFLI